MIRLPALRAPRDRVGQIHAQDCTCSSCAPRRVGRANRAAILTIAGLIAGGSITILFDVAAGGPGLGVIFGSLPQ